MAASPSSADVESGTVRTGAAAASSWSRIGGVVLLLVAVLSVLLTAFAWPAARSALHGVPLAIAGQPAAVAQVSAALEQERPGAFAVRVLPDEAAAVAAIGARQVYGAVVLGGTGAPRVLTASAASPVIAQGLTQLAQSLGAQASPAQQGAGQQAAVAVRDVVAAPAQDPRGATLAAGALPLVLGGIATAGVLAQLVRGGSRRLSAAVAVAAAAGLAMTTILHLWLGALDGSFAAEWGVISLSFAAVSITLLGLEWLLGLAGLGLGAATMLLLGNPLSGVTSAPEMLPPGWGALGQLLPPGAMGTALRSESFFDGEAAARPLLVLCCWLLAGVALCIVATARSRSRSSA
jgi:hypothetical protein